MGNVRYHTRLRCAYALYSHGELERALQHWLDALTAPETVAEFYAIIWPSGFNIELDSEKKVIPTGYKPRSYPEKWFGFLFVMKATVWIPKILQKFLTVFGRLMKYQRVKLVVQALVWQ